MIKVIKKKNTHYLNVAIIVLATVISTVYLFSDDSFLNPLKQVNALTCLGTSVSGDADPVTNPVYGPYNTSDPRELGPLIYASPTGIDLPFHLYLPYNTGSNQAPTDYPLIILVQGGFFNGTDPDMGSSEVLYRTWTSHGYAIASIITRTKGANAYGPVDFPSPLEDIRSMIHYMKINGGEWNVDTDRIVLMGTSSGGVLATLAGLTDDSEYPSEFGCYPDAVDSSIDGVILINGMIDSSEFECVSQGGGVWCNDDEVSGGDVAGAMMDLMGCDPDAWSIGQDPLVYCPALLDGMPDTYAGVEDTTPFLIVHGANDDRVYAQSAIAGAASLFAAGVDVTRCEIDTVSNGGNVPDNDYNDTGHTQRGILWEKDTVLQFLSDTIGS